MPEAPGAREGVSGAGPTVRLLVLGDSAAAGVGAPHQELALSGRLVEELSHDHRVEWRLHARSGATTESALASLSGLGPARFDVAVTSLGVNDVVSGVPLGSWLGRQAELRSALREAFGVRQVVVSGLPPVHGFPALPQPLRWYLGRRAIEFDTALEADVASDPGASFLRLDFANDAKWMAPDGFHPGPAIYEAWGRQAARVVREKLAASRDNGG